MTELIKENDKKEFRDNFLNGFIFKFFEKYPDYAITFTDLFAIFCFNA